MILPELMGRSPNGASAWSAGAADGQESEWSERMDALRIVTTHGEIYVSLREHSRNDR
jgi:hypothetical protein